MYRHGCFVAAPKLQISSVTLPRCYEFHPNSGMALWNMQNNDQSCHLLAKKQQCTKLRGETSDWTQGMPACNCTLQNFSNPSAKENNGIRHFGAQPSKKTNRGKTRKIFWFNPVFLSGLIKLIKLGGVLRQNVVQIKILPPRDISVADERGWGEQHGGGHRKKSA